MKLLHVHATGKDQIRISGIPPLLVLCLRELPEILAKRDTPGVRTRLFPAPTRDDAKANHEWEHLIVPDLHHLFAAAGETVAHDLAKLEKTSAKGTSFRITFAAKDLNAWLSAVNEARLILGEMFAVTEQDLSRNDFNVEDPKDFAVLKISALGWLMERLVAFSAGV